MKKIKRPFLWSIVLLLITIFFMFTAGLMFKMTEIKAGIFFTIISLFILLIVIVFLLPQMIKNVIKTSKTNIYFKIKPLGYLFISLIILIALAGINTGNNLLYLIFSFLLSSIIVSGIISRSSLYKISVNIENASDIYARKNGEILCNVKNKKKKIPSFSIVLEMKLSNQTILLPDGSKISKEITGYYPYIEKNKKIKDTGKINFPFRGIYKPESTFIHTSFPFGFFKKGKHLPSLGEVIVFPELLSNEEMKSFDVFKDFEEETNKKGIGTDLYSLRKYIPGEDTRHIHWKSSAKTGTLIVKDFSEVKSREKILIVDNFTDKNVEGYLWEKFERLISILATSFLKTRENFSFFSFQYGKVEKGYELTYLSKIKIERLRSSDIHPINSESSRNLMREIDIAKTIVFTFLNENFYKSHNINFGKVIEIKNIK